MRNTAIPSGDTAQALFSKNLARWRRASGLPLKEVAPELGVSISTLDSWEIGDRFPTGEHLDAISSHTGIPLCRLFCHDQTQCPTRRKE